MQATNLDQYMTRYGSLLAAQASASVRPLHRRGVDAEFEQTLLREPLEGQKPIITANIKALRRQKSVFVVGECGSGKTLIGAAIAHGHAGGDNFRPYRALVFCPPHLVEKWQRELRETIPNVITLIVK